MILCSSMSTTHALTFSYSYRDSGIGKTKTSFSGCLKFAGYLYCESYLITNNFDLQKKQSPIKGFISSVLP